MYAQLGSAVTVVEMTGGLLPGADRDLVDILAKRVNGTMKSVLLNTRVTQMKPEKKGIRVFFEGDTVTDETKEQVFDRVLVSVGRRPNASVPGLDKTKVQVNERGFIPVASTAAQFADIIKSDTAAWQKVIKEANIKPE